jgi:hypothetical protein
MLAVVAAGALALSMSGCLGEPEPTPTPTLAFATDEEAFAAAEETYRAYIDALNARNADSNSDLDPADYLIERALESHLETVALLQKEGIRTDGAVEIASVEPQEVESGGDIVVHFCLDATNTRVVNDAGDDVTPADRPPRALLSVRFIEVGPDVFITESIADSTC